MTTKRYTNNCILAFGDTHFPYQHKDALRFLKDVRDFYNPDRIVCLGDILDLYSISIYPKDIDHPDSWHDEIKKGRKQVSKLADLFPHMEVLSSNHDDRMAKKSRVAGIPRDCIVPYTTVIGAPDTWKWHRSLTLTVDSTREHIFFAHTIAGGALTCAKDLRMSVVLGHAHTKFGAEAFRPNKNKLLWGIDAGCLISDKGAPYSYNKMQRGRPINGCVIIQDGVPMNIPLC